MCAAAYLFFAISIAISHALDPSFCKLPNYSPRDDVALGFPRFPYRLSPVGNVRWAILAIDFPDLPATATPSSILAQLEPAAALYGSVSYGRLTAQLALGVPTVVRMPLPSAAYSFATFDSHRDYLRNATDAACAAGWDPAGGWDSVVAMAAVATPSLGYGPAFCAVPGEGYTPSCAPRGAAFLNSATSGNDFHGWGFKWFNHENSHTMGLVDLYAFSGGGGQFRFTGQWGIMGDISGAGVEFFGWERWLLGWLTDAEVTCLGAGNTTVALAPLSGGGGASAARLIVVPTPSTLGTTGLAVEYRTPLNYDANIPKAGLLVYFMDTSFATGEGPLRVLNAEEGDNAKLQAPLAVGEAFSFAGVRVEHVATDAEGNAVVAIAAAWGA